jgi:hypothetical protein
MVMSAAEKKRRAAAAAAGAQDAPAVDASPEKSTGPKIKPTSEDNPLGSKIRAPATHEKKVTVGDRTVSVVCKLPRGLYLQLTKFVEQDVKVMGGGVEKRKVPMRVGEMVRLKPTSLPFGAIPNYPIVSGFSITNDVDANFWNSYYQQNRNLEMITSGLLCAFDNETEARAYCREYGSLRTGLEPIDPKGDIRVEKENNPNLSDIEIDTGTDVPARKVG